MSEFIFIVHALIMFTAILLIIYNNIAVVKKYKITSDKLTSRLRIAVVSDFHNKKYSRGYISGKIRAQAPDIIVVSGDVTDRRRPDFQTSRQLLGELRAIAPTYYVTGNHEASLGLERSVEENAARDILIDEKFLLFKEYSILGISDRLCDKTEDRKNLLSVFEKLDNFKIVVTHRPTEFEDHLRISDYDVDLLIAGHTHGGVVRVPFCGAVVCPNEGIFPKYSKGLFRKNDTVMVVSGGLGNTGLPFRLNNFPEIVIIDIEN